MKKIVKCKPVDTVEGKFDLVEAIFKGDSSMHWLEFKPVEITQTSKNPDGTDTLEESLPLQSHQKAE
eukprot:2746174-Ditylum_brightwellii.AAC.1